MTDPNLKYNSKPIFAQVVRDRLSRRQFLKGAGIVASAATVPLLPACGSSVFSQPTRVASPLRLTFNEVAQGLDQHLHVPQGYSHQVLLRWGDPIFQQVAEFDPQQQSAKNQNLQFGFNNDFVGFIPLPLGSQNSQHGLLVVNHEHTKAHLMHPGSPKDADLSLEQTKIDLAAHGLSVVEVKRQANGEWQLVKASRYNRRITAETPMQLSGWARGHQRMKTLYSKNGVDTWGTYGNCAGGVTPWGTVLTAEENINKYFKGDLDNCPEQENYRRFGFKGDVRKSWGLHFDRWDLDKNPQEGLHAGWIVEIDPFDAQSKPRKLTSLGRFKHEGCNVHINTDGRVVAYMGDDQKFEYVYRFISRDTYRAGNTAADRAFNLTLLDNGELSVAQFSEDGSLHWQPLVYGQGPLTPANGFHSQADIALDTRKAADLLAATPMDRPEDVEVNPVNGKVYVMLTKNDSRKPDQLNAPNPRAYNKAGQVVELIAPQGDHSASVFKWDLTLLAGNPKQTITNYHTATSDNGWLACPDNCAFDNLGHLWLSTDGAEDHGVADGLWAMPVDNPLHGLSKRFLRCPIGAELCGPFFTPDNTTLFCAIQHPGGDSTFDKPDTRWPDFADDMPCRPALVAIWKDDGGVVGS
ncbi:dTDP-glucose 4,6-dehydratase [Saccharobesus litoralis]|uniref:dTDP-glucose 4,6-dehydratase n=1 Tax=Saccharobesus litoralis TaxID=2172099 RepID=A0A2S0VQB1_9ALTE|nr:PhoX family phosphatase [Saccharobesus litoralis]AWB66397.1 dTDP-glucose 4,6-dehydratase [Saccharobesus litoralis]